MRRLPNLVGNVTRGLMLKAVLDTQLFLRAAINSRSLPSRLLTDFNAAFRLVISPDIRAEIADVLSRPALRRKFEQLTEERVAEIDRIIENALWVNPAETPRVSRDPKDDMFLAAALESAASYLVSEDNDLLSLKMHGQTRIVNALDFLLALQTREGTEQDEQDDRDPDR
jgi:uncharacterized protein